MRNDHGQPQHNRGPKPKGPDHGKVVDPVCGMTIDLLTAKGGSSGFEGVTYYFCNSKCKTKFDANPKSFLVNLKIEEVVFTKDRERIYTCPMHPEVRQKCIILASKR